MAENFLTPKGDIKPLRVPQHDKCVPIHIIEKLLKTQNQEKHLKQPQNKTHITFK